MTTPRGKLVVISGPSGAGKTSVCRALKQHPDVEFSVSATTRAPRRGEVDGVDYHFLSRDDFQRRLGENQFLLLAHDAEVARLDSEGGRSHGRDARQHVLEDAFLGRRKAARRGEFRVR